MKSYVRNKKPSKAYFAELERALNEGWQAAIAHCLFSLHLQYGFGQKRLADFSATLAETVGKQKGRCTDIKAEIEFLKDNYGIDVATVKPVFKVRHETVAERDERIENDNFR